MLPALRTLDRSFSELDRLWRELEGAPRRTSAHLALNLHERDDAFVLVVPAPGLEAKDLELDAEGDRLSLKLRRTVEVPEGFRRVHQERHSIQAGRSLRFRVPINTDGIEARLEHGLLTVTVPKASSALPRRIAIQTN